MKFEIFKNLEQTAIDYKTVSLAIRTADREAQDITRSIESRISAERKQAAIRAAELAAIIGDPARSETIRRMAQAELDNIKRQIYGPSTVEKEAFDDAVSELEQAAADAKTLQTKLSGLLKEARDELEEIRKSTIHDPTNNLDISAGWPAGLRRDFAAMLARAGGETST